MTHANTLPERRDPANEAPEAAGGGPRAIVHAHPRWPWILGGLAFAVLVGAAYAIATRALVPDWDQGLIGERTFMRWIDHDLPKPLDLLFLTVPWTATNITIAPIVYLAAIWLWRRGRRDLAAHLAVVQTGSFALNVAMKHLFTRARPELWPHRGQYAMASFPSGHAIATFSVLWTIAILLHRERGWRWPFWVVGVVSAITLWSRLYLGVHWPTDVAAGGIVGLIWLGATMAGFPRRIAAQRTAPGASRD